MLAGALGFANVFCAGLLAGEEFVIRFGVRAPLAALDPPAHIRLRQNLIRTLRLLVPVILSAALLTGGAALAYDHSAPGTAYRFAGLAILAVFLAITLGGTVPINQAALTWNPLAPPPDWTDKIKTWERLDDWRTVAALAAFACFLLPLARP